MTNLKLLREIAERATPGPWECVLDGQEYVVGSKKLNAPGNMIVSTNDQEAGTMGIICCCLWPKAEGKFIATFNPSLVLELITKLEEQEKKIEELTNETKRHKEV